MKPLKPLLVLFCCALIGTSLFAQFPTGVNLASPRDWSSEFVFKDAFKLCREWTQINLLTGAAASSFTVPLRNNDGYPTAIPFNDGIDNYGVRTFLFTGDNYPIPTGDYTLISEGSGTIRIRQSGGTTFTFSSPSTHTVVQTENTHFIIDIIQSNAADPVRNIRFVMPGFLDSYESEPFHSDFLDFVDHFQCIRFMDWMRTNASTIQHWSDRTPVNYYSQTLPYYGNVPYRGMAYERLVALCNRLEKDAWVNIPHMADDEYIEQFARFLRDNLDPDLKIYVEYSNELWNTAADFPQSIWVGEQGQAMSYPGPIQNQRRLFTVKRSADIFRIFETVFGSESGRLVKVLAAQAGDTGVAQTILSAFLNNTHNVNPTGIGVDALAIAPYFANFVNSATSVDDALNQAEGSLGLAYQRITNHQNMLTNNGWALPLIAYEGGQHLNGPNTTTDALFCEANRHKRMGTLYQCYLTFWYANGGGLFMFYNSVSPCTNSGSWGLKEYTGQPDAEAPKFTAATNIDPKLCIIKAIDHSYGKGPAMFRVFPNPAFGIVQIQQLSGMEFDRVEMFDAYGRTVYSTGPSSTSIDISRYSSGLYLLAFKRNGAVIWMGKVLII